MLKSMTGFSSQQVKLGTGTLSCECRSVNHRYLETQFKLPDILRGLELDFRGGLRKRLQRGKVEVSFVYDNEMVSDFSAFDATALENTLALCQQVVKQWKGPSTLNPLDVLNMPGVMHCSDKVAQGIREQALPLLEVALDGLIEARLGEGEKLQSIMMEKLSTMEEILSQLQQYQDSLYEQQKEKLSARLAKLQLEVEIDSVRLEQELALWLQKADIAEELDRAAAHIGEVTRLLTCDGAHGRRLDFLMQELNREANTIASKAQAYEASQCAVELKVLVEQLREQVQNIE